MMINYNGLFTVLIRVIPSGNQRVWLCVTALFLIPILFRPQGGHAQYDIPENRTWVFGIFGGLDFNSGQPVPIRTAVSGAPNSNGHTGQASVGVSDRSGQLLFYTNGSHVWDRTHNLMFPAPLHSGPMNLTPVTQVTTQGTLVVGVPGSPDQYYVFSLTHPGDHAPVSVALYGKLHVSLVDMQLNGGNGGVVPGRYWQQIGEGLADKMIAVPGDDCNVWLIVHAVETNRFLAYEITPAGISSSPVISAVGSAASMPAPGGRNQYWLNGQMAISHDYKKMAICATNGSFAEIFDFNTTTGAVSNAAILDTGYAVFGLAFAPDNSKLYTLAKDAASPFSGYEIFQFDMAAGTPTAIRQSKTKVNNGHVPRSQLKVGPDRRIYFGNSKDVNGNTPADRGRILGTILNPNLTGAASGFVPRAVELLDSTSMIYGLSHEVTFIRDSVFFKHTVQRCLESELLEAPPGYEFYQWNDGSSAQSITVSQDGVYWVIGKKGCVIYVDTFEVRTAITVSLPIDTVVCTDPQPITLRPDTDHPISAYLWSDGSTGRTIVARASGTYWVRVTAANGCVASDTINITLTNLVPNLGNDTVYCDPAATPVTLAVTPPPLASVLWSDGSSDHAIQVSESGTWWVRLREGACEVYDTIQITFADIRPDIGSDHLLCREDAVEVQLGINTTMPEGSSILWSNGSATPTMVATDTGSYWVEVRFTHCVGADTVSIRSAYCDCAVSFPTAFTPNGDGRNDVFRPVVGKECTVSQVGVIIYNRWGEVVFATQSLTMGWDGTCKGAPVEPGVYMYHATLTVGTEQHERQYKGDVTLIR